MREAFLSFLPPLIGGFIFNKIRKDFLTAIKAQGMGRHTREEIIQFVKNDLKSLSVLLGSKEFFMGDRPTSLDACAYGFLVQQFGTPWEGPVKPYAKSLKNLESYCERMKNLYW